MVNTKGHETLVFSPKDGCTFTLKPAPGGFAGELSAYRNSCILDQATDREVEDAIPLGRMRKVGSCWDGSGAEVCVTR